MEQFYEYVKELCLHKDHETRSRGYSFILTIFAKKGSAFVYFDDAIEIILKETRAPNRDQVAKIALVYLEKSGNSSKNDAILELVVKCWGGHSKCARGTAMAITASLCEAGNSRRVVETCCQAVSGQKNLSLLVAAVTTLTQLMRWFGPDVIDCNDQMLMIVPVLFDHKNRKVQEAGNQLLFEMFRWFGNDLLPKLSVLTAAQLKELRAVLDEIGSDPQPPTPTRFVRESAVLLADEEVPPKLDAPDCVSMSCPPPIPKEMATWNNESTQSFVQNSLTNHASTKALKDFVPWIFKTFQRSDRSVRGADPDVHDAAGLIIQSLIELVGVKKTEAFIRPESPKVRIESDSFLDGKDFSETLTRAMSDESDDIHVPSTLKPVQKTIEEADIDSDVILVSDSTVEEQVTGFVQVKEPSKGTDPDESFAYGAAVPAGAEPNPGDLVLVQRIPLTMGVETAGGVMAKVIRRNDVIPTKKSLTFSTAADNQHTVTVQVFEGERVMTKENHLIGNFDLSGIAPAPRGVPQIEVTFEIDANGILQVSAENKSTGKSENITVTNDENRLTQDDIEGMIKDAEMFADEDKLLDERLEARNELEYVYSKEKLGSKLSDDEKNKIEQMLEIVADRKVMGTEEREEIRNATFELIEAAALSSVELDKQALLVAAFSTACKRKGMTMSLKVSAENKKTGNKAQITITHERNIPDDLERMLKDAEKFAEEDDSFSERVEGNQIEYVKINDQKLGAKFSDDEKAKIEEVLNIWADNLRLDRKDSILGRTWELYRNLYGPSGIFQHRDLEKAQSTDQTVLLAALFYDAAKDEGCLLSINEIAEVLNIEKEELGYANRLLRRNIRRSVESGSNTPQTGGSRASPEPGPSGYNP